MKDKSVIVTVINGVIDVAFSDEEVQVLIIEDASPDLYTYENSIVRISHINDDGTLDLTLVSTSDGNAGNKKLYGIPATDLEWYSDDEDDDFDDDFLEDVL